MRKCLALSMALVLSMIATSAFADFEEDVMGRTVKVGDPINFCEEIVPETQWYVIKTLYSGQSAPAYFWAPSGYVYTSYNGIEDVQDGMDPTTIDDILLHFIPVSVSGSKYDTYYIQFANEKYIEVYVYDIVTYKYCYTTTNVLLASAFNVYNTGNTAGHFGFYTADAYGTNASLYSWGGCDSDVYPWQAGGAVSRLNSPYDFAIIPIDLVLPEMDEHELALYECQTDYSKYIRYVGTFEAGTEPGTYGVDEVAAFEAAVAAAAACDSEDTDALTVEQLTKWKEDMESTYQAVLDSYKAQVTPDDGYYYIKMVGYDLVGLDPAMWAYTDSTSTCYAECSDWQPTAYFLWKLTNKGGTDYDVRNMTNNATFNYVNYWQKITMSEEGDVLVDFDYVETNSDGEYIVKIRQNTADPEGDTFFWSPSISTSTPKVGISGWYSNYGGAQWKLVAVSDEDAQAIIDSFDYDQFNRYVSTIQINYDATAMMEIAYDGGSATSQAVAMGDIYSELESQLALALAEGENITEETYNALLAAYNAFLAVYVDPTEMRSLLSTATDLANGVVIGTNPGWWTSTSPADEIKVTVENATAYDAAGVYTAEQTANYIETLESQIEALNDAAIKVQPNKWYEIRHSTEEEATEHGWGNYGSGTDEYPAMNGKYISVCELTSDTDGTYYVESLTNSDAEEPFLNHSLYFQAKEDMQYEDFAKFRFINVGDSAYMIQNKATGLFLRSMATVYEDVVLSPHPSLFVITPQGYGESAFAAETVEGTSHSYLYGWYNRSCLSTWTTHRAGSDGAFYIEDIDETIPDDYEAKFNMSAVIGKVYTFCYPVPVTAVDGDVYGAEVEGTTVTLSKLDDNTAQAGEPFIYMDGIPEDYDETQEEEMVAFILGTEVAREPLTSGSLVGNYYDSNVGPGNALAQDNGFWVITNGLQYLEANTAYLTGLESTDDLTIVISEEEFDSVDQAIATVSKENGNIYSIDGKFIGKGNLHSVRSLARGIYIVNGVKVVVK